MLGSGPSLAYLLISWILCDTKTTNVTRVVLFLLGTSK